VCVCVCVYPCTDSCLTPPAICPTQGEGRSCKYNLHFINEADETFIGGGQATILFVLMYGRVPTVDINICEVGGGGVSLWLGVLR
jgi:threonine dehydratase